MNTPLADLRKSYERFELNDNTCPMDPLVQFQIWLDQAIAAQLPEPTAMTLATVGLNHQPSTRVVLLKDLHANGLVWYTNYQSRKGQELAANPCAALQFHWVELERVVRIEGVVAPIAATLSDAYFQSRPLDSRLGAWASPQSEVIASRAMLEDNLLDAKNRFGEQPTRPEHWGGYCLTPQLFEFWQGRPSRLHDRVRYRLIDQQWQRDRLAP
jgi:pyridoxamine 5'-phosphate oxidase